MRLRLGPVLYIGKCDAKVWRFHVGVLVEGAVAVDAPPLRLGSQDEGVEIGAPSVAADFSPVADAVFWRWPVSVRREPQERFVGYRLEATRAEKGDPKLPIEVRHVAIPALGCLPRFFFFSCNGISSPGEARKVTDLNVLWKRMYQIHVADKTGPHPALPSPLHLLLGGGDQIYADQLWEDIPELYEFSKLSAEDKQRAQPSAGFYGEVLRGFLDTYEQNWGAPERAPIFARLPGLFTWDDHDIFDNWGSYGDEMTACAYYQQIYRAASLCFEAFQLGGADGANRLGRGHYLQAASFHEPELEVDLLVLDLRSGRGERRVMAERQHEEMRRWLDEHAKGSGPRRHLLIVSSIPFVFMTFEVAEKVLAALPDDFDLVGNLRDQWEHEWHREERKRVLLQLLEHESRASCQITVLSGDVHIAGHGRIISVRPEHRHPGHSIAVIDQMMSSGIVHPAPSNLESLLVELTGRDTRETLVEGVIAELLEADPDGPKGERYLWVRNFLLGAFQDPPAAGPEGYRGWLLLRLMTELGPQPQLLVDP